MDKKLEIKIKTFKYVLYKLAFWHSENELQFKNYALNQEYSNYYLNAYVEAIEYHMQMPSASILKRLFNLDIGNNFKIEPLSKDVSLLFLFFICMASSDRYNVLYIFDNFHALQEGVMEKDVLENYVFGQDYKSFSKSEDDPEDIVNYVLIDKSIKNLRSKDPYLIYKEARYLKFLHVKHIAWQVYSLDWGNNQIPNEILLQEKSYFSMDVGKMMFS